tara:strand:- start:147 stop:458 length:312 start_codon:yes stop_codon:yes gene_type:complete
MIADGLRIGELIELRWRQRYLNQDSSERVLKMVLLNPVLANIGTMEQRLAGWNCQVLYDSYQAATKTDVPYNKHYEIKWLKLCERQGNLKIISQAQLKDETGK